MTAKADLREQLVQTFSKRLPLAPDTVESLAVDAEQLFEAYAAEREAAARIDELGHVGLQYGHYLTTTYHDGEELSVEERIQQLRVRSAASTPPSTDNRCVNAGNQPCDCAENRSTTNNPYNTEPNPYLRAEQAVLDVKQTTSSLNKPDKDVKVERPSSGSDGELERIISDICCSTDADGVKLCKPGALCTDDVEYKKELLAWRNNHTAEVLESILNWQGEPGTHPWRIVQNELAKLKGGQTDE